MSGILSIHPNRPSMTPRLPKMPADASITSINAAISGLVYTSMAGLHHPELLIWNRP